MKLQTKRAALEKINRRANEMSQNPACDAGTDMIKVRELWHRKEFWRSIWQNGGFPIAMGLQVLHDE
jgi:phage-related protein